MAFFPFSLTKKTPKRNSLKHRLPNTCMMYTMCVLYLLKLVLSTLVVVWSLHSGCMWGELSLWTFLRVFFFFFSQLCHHFNTRCCGTSNTIRGLGFYSMADAQQKHTAASRKYPFWQSVSAVCAQIMALGSTDMPTRARTTWQLCFSKIVSENVTDFGANTCSF